MPSASSAVKFVPLLIALAVLQPARARTLELGFPNLPERVQVSFPENHEAGKRFPAIFYYHGTNGKPDTGLMRAQAGPDDWFVVGMSYVQPGKFTLTTETIDAELLVLRSVIRHLSANHGLDPKRVHLAGFSKGGWLSGLLLQRERSLAGAAILGAGHMHQLDPEPAKFPASTAVFLGVGRKDGNYPFSLRAISFYRGLGAATTMETWHGLGHRFPPGGSPALRQWLQTRRLPPEALRAAAADWPKNRLDEIAAIPDPVDRWVAHLDAEQAPYFRLLDDDAKARFTTNRQALERTAAVKPEAALLVRHRQILRADATAKSKADYQKLAADYLALAQSAPGTRQGKIARHDAQRVEGLLLHFDEQEKLRKADLEPFGPENPDDPFLPKAPDKRPIIPKNPLVR